MFDDVAALFHENVVDAFKGYLESRTNGKAGRSQDLRAAINAASALYHFREHLPATFPKNRADVVAACPDYSLLGDVVNASKHKTLTRNAPQLDSAEQIEEQVVVTVYQDEQGEYSHVEKRVVLRLSSGGERDLLDILTNVMNFWQVELVSLGFISPRPSCSTSAGPQPRPRAESNDGQLDLEVIAGIRFKQVIRLQRYNYTSNQIEPVDLSGSVLECGAYTPCHKVNLTLTDKRTGRSVKRMIDLSEKETEQLLACRSDRDKQLYLATLPQAHEALRELNAEAHSGDASFSPGDPTA